MKALRTPEARFANIPDYPFNPHYVTVGDKLCLHYVDYGPRDGRVVIMMHGEPSWSFLYRHMIKNVACLLYTSPSPRDRQKSRMPSSA